MILALIVAPMIGGWRSVFYITGSLGIVIAAFIYFGVKEVPRGKAEPEFEDMAERTCSISTSHGRKPGRFSRRGPCGSSLPRALLGISPGT